MKNIYTVALPFSVLFLLLGSFVPAQITGFSKEYRVANVLYFNPEIFPEVAEIKEPTYTAFFSALSDNFSSSKNAKLLRADYQLLFDEPDIQLIREFCKNNNAQFAVVPKVKYFKVGIGSYVFSNQVIISMKIYNASGELLAESSHDTYKKNGRLLGSAENSIKIGTFGALKNINKILRKKYRAGYSTLGQDDIFPTAQFTKS